LNRYSREVSWCRRKVKHCSAGKDIKRRKQNPGNEGQSQKMLKKKPLHKTADREEMREKTRRDGFKFEAFYLRKEET
jgi:hypothetical protein